MINRTHADLSTVRCHPDLPGAPALDRGLILGAVGVEVPGTHVVGVARIALPRPVVEIHGDNLGKSCLYGCTPNQACKRSRFRS